MNLITIYEEDNKKIQIYDFAAEYLEYVINNTKFLSPIKSEAIISLTLNEISKKYSLKDKKIITTSKVPILYHKKVFDLMPEYSFFEDAVLLLSDAFDHAVEEKSQKWRENVANYIKSHYYLTFQKECDILFFSEKDYGISIEIILIENEKIIVLPIFLNENDFYQKLI